MIDLITLDARLDEGTYHYTLYEHDIDEVFRCALLLDFSWFLVNELSGMRIIANLVSSVRQNTAHYVRLKFANLTLSACQIRSVNITRSLLPDLYGARGFRPQ
jgi:hypothetical protein